MTPFIHTPCCQPCLCCVDVKGWCVVADGHTKALQPYPHHTTVCHAHVHNTLLLCVRTFRSWVVCFNRGFPRCVMDSVLVLDAAATQKRETSCGAKSPCHCAPFLDVCVPPSGRLARIDEKVRPGLSEIHRDCCRSRSRFHFASVLARKSAASFNNRRVTPAARPLLTPLFYSFSKL